MAISEEHIAEVTKKMFEEANLGREDADMVMDRTSVEDVPMEPVDYYQQAEKKRSQKINKPTPRGASTLTKEIATEELEKLSKLKKRAEMDVEYWKARGDKERAQMAKDQYIEEHFLPAVEMVIIASTPDEVLNAKDILKEFDNLSLQYGPGYTASYIRTAYGDQLGNASARSDGYVQSMVERIKFMSANDQIRAAFGTAKKLKEEIDNGEHTADEDDYEIITRVASIG